VPELDERISYRRSAKYLVSMYAGISNVIKAPAEAHIAVMADS